MSEMGCSDSLNLKPCAGETRTGAVMVTPAIGPATVGAVGDELLEVWHPASASRSRPHESVNVRDVMATSTTTIRTRQAGAREKTTHPAYRLAMESTLRRSGLLGSDPTVQDSTD